MTRRERVLERATVILAAELVEAMVAMTGATVKPDTADTVAQVAIAQADEELGPPPYMPYGWNRVNMSLHAVRDGVPIEDL